MKIYTATDFKDMSRKAANIISAQIILNEKSVLGLATGSSPIGVYQQLIEWYKKGDVDFSSVTTINLDEYVGLAPDDPHSYRYFMKKYFFSHINIHESNTYLPNGLQKSQEFECMRYECIIRNNGGIDMQLLGLGHNGHIGFNEPNAAFEADTHCVTLSQDTREANKRFFDTIDDVPRQAYTMGIKTIMQARRIVVIVSGESKAEIVKRSFFGSITPDVPASVLQLHNNVTLVGDKAALSLI
ncbi:MAG: glucosamine-6-phosphate deaminase [Clostridiales bacterium]|jgi:glucosamine-6-phosphate deaminase|nr:glucosamine-6-phosphate deaminase [Clostridiales bacterium]